MEKPSPLGRRVHIVLETAQLEKRCGQRLEKLRRETRLPGFRKGKAPLRLIRARFEAELRHEESQRLLRENLDKALAENTPDIIGEIRIVNPEPRTVTPAPNDAASPLRFSAEFEVYPEFDLDPLRELELEKPVPQPITDVALERMSEELRHQHRRLDEVARPAGPGDVVEVDLCIPATTAKGSPREQRLSVELEGGMRENAASGTGQDGKSTSREEWLRRALPGARAGEWLNLKPPREVDRGETDRGGVILPGMGNWRVKVRRVRAPHLPELRSELLPKLGFEATQLEEFRVQLAHNMEQKAFAAAREWQWESMLTALSQTFEFELPEAALEGEKQHLLEMWRRTFEPRTAPPREEQSAAAKRALEQQALWTARRHLRQQILLHKLMLHFKPSASRQEVRAAMHKAAAAYKDPESALQAMTRDETQERHFKEQVLTEKLLAAVHGAARVHERALDFFTLRAGPPTSREAPPELYTGA